MNVCADRFKMQAKVTFSFFNKNKNRWSKSNKRVVIKKVTKELCRVRDGRG